MELIIGAFIFYFVIKYAVKNAITEAKVHETELGNQVRANDLFHKISNIEYEITADKKSKELKKKSKEIYDESFDILVSDRPDEEKIKQLKIKENEMNLLKSERIDFE
ncbi:hypothetical protein [Jeotgalicoccus psychrophilus]|uniref:hypothetical protein n=1 Tax=Jeotgalicoccus psychrophilus TaxID=157228 RepID=UPI0004041E64|nr:hypothetical protein [Jeotgalicoccus psychrophilus]